MHLCLRCGLCCDGTLFHAVPLQPGEADALRGRVKLDDAETRLLQGCAALGADCACGVYEARPQACRRFRCAVLSALESGRCTEAEATSAIDEVLSLRARLSAELGLDDPRAAVGVLHDADPSSFPASARPLFEQLNRALVLLQLTTT